VKGYLKYLVCSKIKVKTTSVGRGGTSGICPEERPLLGKKGLSFQNSPKGKGGSPRRWGRTVDRGETGIPIPSKRRSHIPLMGKEGHSTLGGERKNYKKTFI